MNQHEKCAIILAAGKGTRMKSDKAKVLHEVCGDTLLGHVLRACEAAGVTQCAVIVGHEAQAVRDSLPEGIRTFEQIEQNGTGHAVMQALPFLEEKDGTVFVMMGDAPLIRPETLNAMADYHCEKGFAATVLSAVFEDPTGYGRMVKDGDQLVKIVEQKDATPDELAICEINAGMYCFDAKALAAALKCIKPSKVSGEYYLTDTIEILREAGKGVGTFVAEDPTGIAAVNSKVQLAEVAAVMRDRINRRLMADGVVIIDPKTTYLSVDTVIGRDTVVYPGVITEGKVTIGEDCIVGHNSRIVDSVIADGVEIQISTILQSTVDSGTHVGPYAYLRPNSRIGKHVKVGDFVEVKNAVMHDGAKASHLTYIGDAEVGRRVNLGCGTVFVNYDGVNKFRTVVEDDCFIGCNSNLISPVTVKAGSYVAAGSTITTDVPEKTLAVARARQVNKVGYAETMPQLDKTKKKK